MNLKRMISVEMALQPCTPLSWGYEEEGKEDDNKDKDHYCESDYENED
jgi:hypothetical protein